MEEIRTKKREKYTFLWKSLNDVWNNEKDDRWDKLL
jgi:hypothetical protein